MIIKQFRERHSLLLEHYQYIEMHLEGIYAALCNKNFHDGLQDVEKTNLFRLLVNIERIEKDTGRSVIASVDKMLLKRIIQRRNYWVHNCYTEPIFERKTDNIKDQVVDVLEDDIRDAESLRQNLYEVFMKNRNQSTF